MDLKNNSKLIGAIGGGLVGAGGSLASYLTTRRKLMSALDQCGDEACRDMVHEQLAELRSNALAKGFLSASLGAGAGAVIGAGYKAIGGKTPPVPDMPQLEVEPEFVGVEEPTSNIHTGLKVAGGLAAAGTLGALALGNDAVRDKFTDITSKGIKSVGKGVAKGLKKAYDIGTIPMDVTNETSKKLARELAASGLNAVEHTYSNAKDDVANALGARAVKKTYENFVNKTTGANSAK